MEVNDEKADNKNKKYGSDDNDMINSSNKGIFDKVSKEKDTGSIKGEISLTAQQEDNKNDKMTSFTA